MMNKNTSMQGISFLMCNGQVATCIEDRGCNDISIQFEDGTIVKATRGNFRKGSVTNPTLGRGRTMHLKYASQLGTVKMMNCGLKCKLIKFDRWDDISVQFEDDTIVEHKIKSEFDRGNILHPSMDRHYTVRKNNSILGVRKQMNDGSFCEVIEYITSEHITVKFDDGTIIKDRTKQQFELGYIHNPSVLHVRTQETSLVGYTVLMCNGQYAECIEDLGEKNITVEFDDGYIAYNKTRGHFLEGHIYNPNALNNISVPQCIVYYYIQQYFPDVIVNYRPDWLKMNAKKPGFELDLYIPSKSISIEYDGAIFSHLSYKEAHKTKATLINNSDIKKHITILEKGCVKYGENFTKFTYYELATVSTNYTVNYLYALKNAIEAILNSLGITNFIVDLDRYKLNDILEFRRSLNE